MDLHRQYLFMCLVLPLLLTGAHGTLDHRGDDLQMRGVERQHQVHLASSGNLQVGGEAPVVLHGLELALGVRVVV